MEIVTRLLWDNYYALILTSIHSRETKKNCSIFRRKGVIYSWLRVLLDEKVILNQDIKYFLQNVFVLVCSIASTNINDICWLHWEEIIIILSMEGFHVGVFNCVHQHKQSQLTSLRGNCHTQPTCPQEVSIIEISQPKYFFLLSWLTPKLKYSKLEYWGRLPSGWVCS